MKSLLSVAVAQPLCLAGNLAQNALAHAQCIRSSRARLVVFPELSLTGYELDSALVATDSPVFDEIARACRDSDSLVVRRTSPIHDRISKIAPPGRLRPNRQKFTKVTFCSRGLWGPGPVPRARLKPCKLTKAPPPQHPNRSVTKGRLPSRIKLQRVRHEKTKPVFPARPANRQQVHPRLPGWLLCEEISKVQTRSRHQS